MAAWAALKSGFGWSSERVMVSNGKEAIAGAQVLFRTLAPGMTLGYVPRGPLVDLSRSGIADTLFEHLHHACHARGAFALRIEPNLVESADLRANLSSRGFRGGMTCVQPRRTIWIDLEPTEDEILGRMKSKTRYNIRLAARKAVQVHSAAEAELKDFNDLMSITGERDEFGVRSPDYYRQMYRLYAPSDSARLFIATYQGQPLAGLLALAAGPMACYIAGASANEHRERMPTYAVQWAAIRWARERGCHTYDLYGIPDYDEERLEAAFTERSDGLWGVYRFKRGFGGKVVRLVGSYDYVYRPLVYKLYQLGTRLWKG
jgi:lipid II:glycine glycyltransferase (peptidoglycan interpeptide bridge formation enzyme)